MNQLDLIEKMTPAEIYTAKTIDSILEKIKSEVATVEPDLTTVAGRKEIASLAYKIAQSKTYMDSCGKKIAEDAQKKVDEVNAERKKIRDTLDALKHKVREPLTKWENDEELRVRQHQDLMADATGEASNMSNMWQTLDIQEMKDVLAKIKTDKIRDWQEFTAEAETIFTHAIEKIETAIARRVEYDDQQAELAKLREEKAQREKAEADRLEKERTERLAREQAEESARVEAKRIADENARLKREADLKVELERQNAERQKQMALDKEKAVQREKELAEQRAKEAAAKAERDKKLAVENERRRIEAEAREKVEAEQKRQANLKHRTKINNEILVALKAHGVDDELGKKIITAIVTGLVPHTKITY